WAEGRNIQIDIHWAANPSEIRRQAAELVALAPDVILAAGTNIVGVDAGDAHGADRVPDHRRSSRRWLRRKFGSPGRQRHRLHAFRIQHQRKVARTAQANRAWRNASSGPWRS